MEYFAYSQKEFVYKYVVMLSDVDQFKHMSFANYLKLMFLATDALFLSCSNVADMSERRLKLIDSRMQFKRQTVAGDKLLIKVNVSDLRAVEFVLLYTFVMEDTAELIALGRQTYQMINNLGRSIVNMPPHSFEYLTSIAVEEQHLLYKY